jgi:hypothetical protein
MEHSKSTALKRWFVFDHLPHTQTHTGEFKKKISIEYRMERCVEGARDDIQ